MKIAINPSIEVTPRKLSVAHGRRIFPPGFVRAGGNRLPPKQREEALREIEAVTTGMNPAQRFATIQKVVAKKWQEVTTQPSDVTQLSYGRSSVPTYTDPDAREQARRMLLWIPTTPEFAGALEPIEATVWSMDVAGDSQDTIASAIGKSQGEVSKTRRREVPPPVFNVIRPVPRCVPGAESLVFVSRRCGKVDG